MNCVDCQRASRPKTDEHGHENGHIECKASADSNVLMLAFDTYAKSRQCVVPFVVFGVPERHDSAWPLLFHPDTIARCEGFAPRDAR